MKKEKTAIPDYRFNLVTDITIEDIKNMGVTALALDLDNTTVPDAGFSLNTNVDKWIENMKSHGIKLIVVSNTGPHRAFVISRKMGKIPFVAPACKPSPRGIYLAAKILKTDVEKIAMVGDNIFKDIMAANRAGAVSVKVEPFSPEVRRAEHYNKMREKEKAYLASVETQADGD